MICVQLNGGLGNQMFQYAFGKALAHKHQTELLLDTSLLQKKVLTTGPTPRVYELNCFQLTVRIAPNKGIKRIQPTLYRITNSILLRTGCKGIQTSRYFTETKFSYDDSITKIGKDCFLAGYWQSALYFNSIESIIRTDFKFSENLDKKNNQILIKINTENSISIHIRRSDFVNSKFHTIHGSCSIEYYKKAIEFIANKVNDPFFFIFSDDVDWVRKELNLKYPNEYVSGNVGKQSYIDMQLMSRCKHNIIANSSFSWWGAWLNKNPDKFIIAPLKWFANEKMNSKTEYLIPNTWKRL